jgi:hypothetical protein
VRDFFSRQFGARLRSELRRRGFALDLGLTAAFAAIAATPMDAVAVQITCPLDNAGHGFLGHFVPVVVVAALALLGRGTLTRKNAA